MYLNSLIKVFVLHVRVSHRLEDSVVPVFWVFYMFILILKEEILIPPHLKDVCCQRVKIM